MSEKDHSAPHTQPRSIQALQTSFRKGVVLHQQGKLADAERIYAETLEQHPKHFDAMHLLGVLALQTGRTKRGIELIRKAIEINTAVASAHNNMGNGLKDLRRPEEALASYDKAIALKPEFAEALNNRGAVLRELARFEEAIASCDKAIALKPDYVGAHKNRGRALQALKRSEEALASYDKVIALKPDYAGVHNDRGNALQALERFEEALTSYDKAIALKPDYAGAFNNRGSALQNLKRSEEALVSYDMAVALKPDYAGALNNRGSALQELERPGEALASCDQAIALKPDYAMAYYNRGIALQALGRPEEALASYDKAIALNPNYSEAHNNRGSALQQLKRAENALASYGDAIALNPDYAEAHWNQSLCLLLVGRFEEGWRQYEWRKKLRDEPLAVRPYSQPLWLGEEDIAGKILFIYWEQGLGDTIQFCRYAKMAEARGARVILSVQDPLCRLLTPLSPSIRIVRGKEQPVDFDFHTPLQSLPLAFATTSETIPAEIPYLRAEHEKVERWKHRLAGSGFKIGISWQGKKGKVDIGRSYPLRELSGISAIPGVRLFSLQKNEGAEQLAHLPEGMKVETLGEDFDSGPDAFLDTAAVMESLDLIITSDTAVAHLAGALGRPTWVALKHVPDWRWLLEGSESAWYPSLRLFRQNARGDWKSVFDQMRTVLSRRLERS